MKKQNGFSVVVVLLSILVVTALGLTGYYVWNTQNNKKDVTIAGNETSKPTVNKIDYISLNALGIKIPETPATKKYVFLEDSSNQSVTVKSQSLSKMMDDKCMQGHGGDGVVAYAQKIDKNEYNPEVSEFLGEKIYENESSVIIFGYGPGNGWICGSSGSESVPVDLRTELDAKRNEVKEIFKSAQPL